MIRFPAMQFCLAIMWASAVWAAGAEMSEIIQRANSLYQQNQYREAALLYEKALAQGSGNGHVHYNLGNAYMRLGRKGQAILHYLKAKALLPRNEDVEANLNYAIQETRDRLDWKRSEGIEAFLFWIGDFTLSELLTGLLATNLLFWVAVGIWVIRPGYGTDIFRKTALGLLLFTAISTGIKGYLEQNTVYGVVLAPQVDVRSGWGENQATLFKLHEGAVVSLRGQHGNWYQVELLDGKSGWVPKESLGI